MLKNKKMLLMLINSVLFPVTLMLFLYNQNAKYLSLLQVAVIMIILAAVAAGIFAIFRALYRSEQTAFFACLVMIGLVFLYNNIYYKYLFVKVHGHIAILAIPAIAYVAAYLFNRLLNKKKFEDLPEFVSVVLAVVLLINLINFGKFTFVGKGLPGEYEYKTSFVSDTGLPAPNVYFILCDGMLGFDAMEKYFDSPQDELTAELEERGFGINKSAMLEAGHSTRIAIPELMCPEYSDRYMKDVLSNHEKAIELNDSSDAEMFNARYHNETINAFKSKGYSTISMSLNEDVFFPTTDFFYYIAAHYMMDSDFVGLPYYIEKSDNEDSSYYENRFYTQHLGDVFLGGLPEIIFDKLNENNIVRHRLSEKPAETSKNLPGNTYAQKYSALIDSLYDSLYSGEAENPKFTLLHTFMAHFPICFNEKGDLIAKQNYITSYPGHHTFAVKVMMELIDMILEADPDAVIVLQADHGLHGQSKEQITEAFGNGAEIDIWNNVFSAVRVPDKVKNGDEHYAEENPLNISRYLVNSYVGENYAYVTD